MTIAFLSEKYEGVVKALKTTLDSYEVVGGNNLKTFLTTSRERNEFFDRIILVDKVLTAGDEVGDFKFLRNYIETVSPNLEVILTVQRDSGSPLPDVFLSEFSAPMYTVVFLPPQTTANIIQDLVALPVMELKARYYEIDRRSQGNSTSKEEKQAPNKKQEKKKKSGGFFSSLFGGGKKKNEEPDTAVEGSGTSNEVGGEGNVPVPPTVVAPPVTTGFGVPPVTTGGSDDLFAPPSPDILSNVTESPLKALFETGQSSSQEEAEGVNNNNFGGFSPVDDGFSSTDSSDDFDDLNFGDFGDAHAQTGYIGEDEELDVPVSPTPIAEDNESNQDFMVVGSSSGTEDDFSPISTPVVEEGVEVSVSGVGFSPITNTTSNLSFEDLSRSISSAKQGGGVVILTGYDSTDYLQAYLRSSVPQGNVLVVDTLGDLGILQHLDSTKYYATEEEVYEEAGISYLLAPSVAELPDLSSKYPEHVLVVNTLIKDLNSIVRLTGTSNRPITILTLFSPKLTLFEKQLLEFEGVSPVVSRVISSSRGIALVVDVAKGVEVTKGNLGFSHNDLFKVVATGVFSRINWKGLFE